MGGRVGILTCLIVCLSVCLFVRSFVCLPCAVMLPPPRKGLLLCRVGVELLVSPMHSGLHRWVLKAGKQLLALVPSRN